MNIPVTFKPLGNRVLIDIHELPKESVGGILLPDSQYFKGQTQKGTVRAIGSKAIGKLNIGDVVVFEAVYGRETTKEDKQRIIDVGALLAVESSVE